MQQFPCPKLIEIEVTNYCNFKCVMCHCAYMRDDRVSLDSDIFAKVLSLPADFFSISSGFEPLVHPEIDVILNHVYNSGKPFEIITNASLLVPSRVDRICSSNVKSINVSFDSIVEHIYEKIRIGGNYHSVLSNITNLLSQTSKSDIFTAINATQMVNNYLETVDAVSFWEEKGVDQLRFIAMVIRHDNEFLRSNSLYNVRHRYLSEVERAATLLIKERYGLSISSPLLQKSSLRKIFPNNVVGNLAFSDNPSTKRYFNPRHSYISRQIDGVSPLCSASSDFAKILPNGDVQLCYRYSIGNLYQSSFEEIWNGDKASQARAEVHENPAICLGCGFRIFCLESASIDLDNPANYTAFVD